MSRRGFELLIGGVIVLILALKAPLVLSCGLAYTWWMVHRSQGEVRVEAAGRAAMIWVGFAALFQSFLLGLSIRLIGPWLPR
jgi:hypothetical protein